ncbi:YegP family protein [Pusillimonas sp. CC-YST705]|uniref:YegP family protein n=1 Tax=Mesopusillimonas faecipullorum TaxID=2755040 RepID=A0ABS8CDP7_9BURK|nr:YegP family protein [Mesopusillimonas faecipullorum]MCB5364151.1 YegP family protein [Mesopusillimonas faecipullorum]
MGGYYELKRSGSQYMFNLKAGNHEVILTSERYTSKASALNGIASVRTNSPNDDRYQRKVAADERFYFTLTAANGQTIGVSQMYRTEPSRNGGIESVKLNGSSEIIKDEG